MNFSLEWSGPSAAYVVVDAHVQLARRRAGWIRQRSDGLWAAHAWPPQSAAEVVSMHPSSEAAANWVADEFEEPRAPRPQIGGAMPRPFKRSTVVQVSVNQ